MCTIRTALAVVAALGILGGVALAESKKIDLQTAGGVKAVQGEWRYSDVKIVEVAHKDPQGKPNKTYTIEPKAYGPNFDDSSWEVIAPETLKERRSTGLVCFCWYRIKVTIPDEARGKSVFFQTTVDDYGEVWVDGQLPRKPGAVGGPIVAGFNTPNRVELKDARPGKTYQIAVFGINGPISATPTNYIFLKDTFLEFTDKK
jgi:gluconolactonase